MPDRDTIELAFLGSGNAFGAEGRANSSFVLNGRYLLDCGPTLLPQMRKLDISGEDIDAVLISHFHADHFFGLPFLFLDAWQHRRQRDLYIVGPPGIEERTRRLLELGYPMLLSKMEFQRHYIEAHDGLEAAVAGLPFTAASVKHVADMESFAYRAHVDGRALVYSGDTQLCQGLLRLVPGADVLVLECACAGGNGVHLTPEALAEVRRQAPPHATTIVTHLDGHDHPENFEGLIVAQDATRFQL
jgi:ribonuclease BN (tRNA processing enzyme)